jgi:sugar lactone lactonase YvrE
MLPYLSGRPRLLLATLAYLSVTCDCTQYAGSGLLPVDEVFKFPAGTYIEGLAFRPNGKLLGTLLAPEASVYQFDVVDGCAKKVITIPNINGLYGITETKPDQFYIAGGNLSLRASTRQAGSFGIWHLDMTSFERTGKVVPKEVSHFANATLNGLWTFDASRGIILATDSTNGVVYRVDLKTGKNSITIDDPLLKPPVNASTFPSPNGIAVRDGYIYFTNTGAGTFGRVPINAEGVQTGPAEVLAITAGGNPGGDDWTFDKAGNVFVAENPNNWLSVLPKGSDRPVIIAGGPNSTALLGPNTARFGVSQYDKRRGSLYIGTSGGLAQYRSGNLTNGGGVFRVDTALLQLLG